MNPLKLLVTALSSIKNSKLRSSLTLLGVIIGIAAVVGLVGLGRSIQGSIETDISSFGVTLIYVRQTSTGGGDTVFDPATGTTREKSYFTLSDVYALQEWEFGDAFDNVTVTSSGGGVVWVIGGETIPQQDSGGQTVFSSSLRGSPDRNIFIPDNQTSFRVQVSGVTESYIDIFNYDLLQGNFFSSVEIRNRSQSAVLGQVIATDLFGQRSPLGATIAVDGKHFTVIGVIDGDQFTGTDRSVLLPITTGVSLFGSSEDIVADGEIRISESVIVNAREDDIIGEAVQQLQSFFRIQFGENGLEDFQTDTNEELLESLNNAIASLQLFLGAVAAISLTVGGIGVMNTMLVTVTERTREIGLRRALGAKSGHILFQFVFEATTITGIGGILGLAAGIGLGTVAIAFFNNAPQGEQGSPLPPFMVTADIALLAVGVALAVGLLFGTYPAFRASRLQPVDALRRE